VWLYTGGISDDVVAVSLSHCTVEAAASEGRSRSRSCGVAQAWLYAAGIPVVAFSLSILL